MNSFNISIKKAVLWLSLILFLLMATHIFVWFVHFHTSHDIYPLFRIFDVDEEANIPTFYNALLFLLSSVLLILIGTIRRRENAPYSKHWLFLGFLFLFLSVDEASIIHEEFVRPMKNLFDICGGALRHAWVIVYLPLVLILLLWMLRFLRSLPPRIMHIFIVAGIVFISGAVGFELLHGHVYTNYPEAEVLIDVLPMIEEFLEMAGLIIFIKGLLEYIEMSFEGLRFNIVD